MNSGHLLSLFIGFFFHLFLYVSLKQSLLDLEDLFLFLTIDLTIGDLIDENLSSTFASCGCSILSIHLSLNRLQALNFHHHIKSLLLFDPILFKKCVLLELAISNCHDLRCNYQSIDCLDIIISFIHLLLSTGQQTIISKYRHLHCKWSFSLALSILCLHTLLTCLGSRHLLLLLLSHHCILLMKRGLIFDNDLISDAS